MAPLYPPGLDENSAVANLYPASWICSKNAAPLGKIGVTAEYNFSPAPKSRTAWYNFFPSSEVSGTIFSPDSLVPGTIFFPGSEVAGTIFFPRQ